MLNTSRFVVSRFAIVACMAGTFSIGGGLIAIPQAALAHGGGSSHSSGGDNKMSGSNYGHSSSSLPGRTLGSGSGSKPITVVKLPNGSGRGESRKEVKHELHELKHCLKGGHCSILVSEHGPQPQPIPTKPAPVESKPISGTPAPGTPTPMPTPAPTKPPVLSDPGYGAPGTGGTTPGGGGHLPTLGAPIKQD
jgi:hypothetical protein